MNRTPVVVKRKLNIVDWNQFIFAIIFNILIALIVIIAISAYSVLSGRSRKEFSVLPEEMQTAILILKTSDLQNPDGEWRTLIEKYDSIYRSNRILQLNTLIIQDNSFFTSGEEFRPFLSEYNPTNLGIAESVEEVCEKINTIQKAVLISYNDISPRVAFLCNSETNYYGVLRTDIGIRPRILNTLSDIFTKIFDVQ